MHMSPLCITTGGLNNYCKISNKALIVVRPAFPYVSSSVYMDFISLMKQLDDDVSQPAFVWNPYLTMTLVAFDPKVIRQLCHVKNPMQVP